MCLIGVYFITLICVFCVITLDCYMGWFCFDWCFLFGLRVVAVLGCLWSVVFGLFVLLHCLGGFFRVVLLVLGF